MKGVCPSSLFLPRMWLLSFTSSLSGVFIFIHICCRLILHGSNYLFWSLAQSERTVSCRAKRWMALNLSQSDTEDNFSLISALIWFYRNSPERSTPAARDLFGAKDSQVSFKSLFSTVQRKLSYKRITFKLFVLNSFEWNMITIDLRVSVEFELRVSYHF